MTAHLLVIALGPVQDFIAAARRTRDLWFGSFLLSEISKAAAKAIKDNGELVFPCSDDLDRDLAPATEGNATEAFNVVNLILAEIPDRHSAKEIAECAKKAAQERWEYWAKRAYDTAKSIIDKRIWASQIGDVIEFYAAWTPLTGDYAASRQQVMRLMAGRKALRDFMPAKGLPQVPKSSLDGLRESVLISGENREGTRRVRRDALKNNDRLAHRLRLRAGEELDIVAVTKRAATKEVFASVVRVAVDPWVRGIQADSGEALSVLKDGIGSQCQRLLGGNPEDSERVTGTGEHYRDSAFPYDGSVLLPKRLNAMVRETELPEETDDDLGVFNEQDGAILGAIKPLLERLIKGFRYGEPEPYLAVLSADGDRMGRLLSEIAKQGAAKQGADKHRELTQAQSEFASKVRGIVREQDGCTVFAGGDDVLAFVPVDRCLACARELYDAYGKALDNFSYQDDGRTVTPSVSVGIGIGHCLEPLENLLQFARDAEQDAKGRELAKEQQGDGIAVHLHTRGGPSVRLRDGWKSGLAERLEEWIHCHLTDALSDKAAYDLHRLAESYGGWSDRSLAYDAMGADAKLLIDRKKIDKDRRLRIDKHVGCVLRAAKDDANVAVSAALTGLAQEWMVARRAARSYHQALGHNGYAALTAPRDMAATA